MTEQTTGNDAAGAGQQTPAAPDAPQSTPEPPTAPTDADSGSPNREAARYRTQLRETESQRDALSQRLTAAHRREVERLAGDTLADPADLWQSTELEQLLDDETGDLDAGKVAAAVDQLVAAKPHYRKSNVPRPDPTQGARSGGAVEEQRMGAIFTRR